MRAAVGSVCGHQWLERALEARAVYQPVFQYFTSSAIFVVLLKTSPGGRHAELAPGLWANSLPKEHLE